MTSFKKSDTQIFGLKKRQTVESLYWKKFGVSLFYILAYTDLSLWSSFKILSLLVVGKLFIRNF